MDRGLTLTESQKQEIRDAITHAAPIQQLVINDVEAIWSIRRRRRLAAIEENDKLLRWIGAQSRHRYFRRFRRRV